MTYTPDHETLQLQRFGDSKIALEGGYEVPWWYLQPGSFFFIIVLKKEIKIASGCRISQFEKCSYEDFT